MANKPDDPQRPKPNDKNKPPAKQPGKVPQDVSDEEIDLTNPGEEVDLSGISVIEWASLAEVPPSSASAPQPKFDSPSDADIIAGLADQPTLPPPDVASSRPVTQIGKMSEVLGETEAPVEGSVNDLVVPPLPPAMPGRPVTMVAPPGAHEEDLIVTDTGPGVASPVPAAPQGEDSAIDLTSEAFVFEEESVPAPDVKKEDSAIDLTPEDVIEEVPPAVAVTRSDSAIDLTGADLIEEERSPSRLAGDSPVRMEPAGDSEIDLTAEPALEKGSESKLPVVPSDSGIDLITEDVILDQPPAKEGSGSSRDLIAEGLESGVDLHKKGEKHDEDALHEFLKVDNKDESSSAVDLGSSHALDVEEEMKAVAPAGSGSSVRVEDLASPSGESIPIDLEGAASGVAPRPKKAAADEGIDVDLSEVVAEGEDVEVEGAGRKARAGEGEEEALEGAEEEEEKPAKKKDKEKAEAKPRGRAGAWLGGTVLGAVLGSAACLGVWAFGVEPPGQLREMVGTAPAKPANGAPSTGGPGAAAQVAPFEGALGHIRHGDLDKVTAEDLNRADETKAEQLVARAEHRWLSYLRSERGKDAKAPLKADAEPVKQALADLDKAIALKSADALFLRGQIHELTGKAAEAKADYQKGAADFKTDEGQRLRFETALVAMELTEKTAWLAPGMRPALLAVLLAAFQPPPGGAPPAGAPPALPEEAGYRFWQAVKLARAKEWAKATDALEEARERHDRRRWLLPRKPQNPGSDPRQEIFLRAVDEVKGYWSLLAKLNNPNYLTADAKDRNPAVDALLTKAQVEARAALVKELGEKLAKGKEVPSAEALVKLLGDERKANEDKIATLQTSVDDQKKKITDLDGMLATTKKDLDTTKKSLVAEEARAKELDAARTAAEGALKDIGEAVGVKFTDLKSSKDNVVKEVREAKRIAGEKDAKGTIRRLEGELTADRAKLKERWEPDQMMNFWLAILQGGRSTPDLEKSALVDVDRILNDPAATEVQKGRALTIRGLVLRNRDDFDKAKPELEKAQAALAKTKGPWIKEASAALSEVSNPGADLAAKAQALVLQGKQAEALKVLDRGLKIAPGDKGAMYAQRALIELETARAKGALSATDPKVVAAQKDAASAAAGGSAEGHYAAGRLAEELGQMDQAVRSYRAAVAAVPAGDTALSRYRAALARALLKSSGETPAVRPLPPASRTGKATRPANGRSSKGNKSAQVRALRRSDFIGLMLTLTLQAVDLPAGAPNASEAEKLADEILKDDKAPFDARAQALAVKGLYTRALEVYAKGLREQGLLAPAHANALSEIIANFAEAKRPDSMRVPDPVEGERHYAAGVNFYFARRYAEAEKELLAAVENDNGDARYYYFLGLARLAQGKRTANEDFDQAGRLERADRPGRAAVSKALERVQGGDREVLNAIRNRPLKETPR
jgi:tetratricopeptide (TPR) repeat protein